jgi:thiol-disulfide isomerase/thioredoxin
MHLENNELLPRAPGTRAEVSWRLFSATGCRETRAPHRAEIANDRIVGHVGMDHGPAVLVHRKAFVGTALLAVIAVVLSLLSVARAGPECGTGSTCGLEVDAAAPVTLLFFWGVGCPHCEEAKPFVDQLAKENPRLRVEAVEVRNDPEGRRRFVETMTALQATAVGVPTFVIQNSYVVGYVKGETEAKLRAIVAEALRQAPHATAPAREEIAVPWLGEVDPSTVSLPMLTLAIGLADSVNPCAMWVLVVLLGILLHVETTPRMALYAGTFVVMSGVVYFAFMLAWSALFELVGISRVVTRILGAALFAMGVVNVKDVFWFKKGVSLVIPDKAKPGLFRRMRAIARASTTPAALAGIAVLAFVVNLVELGCTLGFPAVYTRILALRGLATVPRLAYLVLYNVVYVIPLLLVVIVFIALKRRLTMTERAARVLKGVSGVLLVTFGVVFLLAPNLLAGG